MTEDRITSEREEKRRRRIMRSAGYFLCGRILSNLEEFEDLVRHDFGFESRYARRSLERLVPGAELPDGEYLLRAKINRLIPRISQALWLARIDTGMLLEKYEQDALEQDPKKVQRESTAQPAFIRSGPRIGGGVGLPVG